MTTLETKIDRLTALLEEQESRSLKIRPNFVREMVLNTILASMVGYFMMRILDCYFRS